MAKLIYGLNQSLDGYVDHLNFSPSRGLFRHFVKHVRGLSGVVYGRVMYDVMRYWDDERSDWGDDERDFAVAWRKQPKFVASRTLRAVGPNATLIAGDVVAAVRALKADFPGEIGVGGPDLVRSLTEAGLIDEYRLYLCPVVVGKGKPYFAGPQPRLQLVGSDVIDGDVIRLAYVPA